MTGLSYSVEGTQAALAALGRAQDALDDATEMWDDIGASLELSTQKRFESGTEPSGAKWPDSWRVKLEGGKTLADTQRLKLSNTHQARADGVEVGTNDFRAPILHEGGVIRAKTSKGLRFKVGGNGGWVTKQSVTIPPRPWLGLGEGDEKEILSIAADFIAEASGGSNADQ